MRATELRHPAHLTLDGIEVTLIDSALVQHVVDLREPGLRIALEFRQLLFKRERALGEVDGARDDDIRAREHLARMVVGLGIGEDAAEPIAARFLQVFVEGVVRIVDIVDVRVDAHDAISFRTMSALCDPRPDNLKSGQNMACSCGIS